MSSEVQQPTGDGALARAGGQVDPAVGAGKPERAANPAEVPAAGRGPHTPHSPTGVDAAGSDIGRLQQSFDRAAADGDISPGERAALRERIGELSAGERQDFFRHFIEADASREFPAWEALKTHVGFDGDTGGQALEPRFAALYDVLQPNDLRRNMAPGTNLAANVVDEFVDALARHASSEQKAVFIEGSAAHLHESIWNQSADEARANPQTHSDFMREIANRELAGHVGDILLSMAGDHAALKDAYNALSDPETRNQALATVLSAGITTNAKSASHDQLNAILQTFTDTLGDDQYDRFRKAGIIEATTRALDHHGVGRRGVEGDRAEALSTLGHLGLMLESGDPVDLIRMMDSSYAEWDGGFQQMAKLALELGHAEVIGGLIQSVRAPIDATVAEVMRAHDASDSAAMDRLENDPGHARDMAALESFGGSMKGAIDEWMADLARGESRHSTAYDKGAQIVVNLADTFLPGNKHFWGSMARVAGGVMGQTSEEMNRFRAGELDKSVTGQLQDALTPVNREAEPRRTDAGDSYHPKLNPEMHTADYRDATATQQRAINMLNDIRESLRNSIL